MRKPYVASAPCLRKSSKKKQISRRRRSVSGNARAPRNDNVEAAAREPLRCGFGAVRVGALLGRVRLHLQTERFLAAHRGDALWEAGCVGAAVALADVVAGMREAELGAPLATQRARGEIFSGRKNAALKMAFFGSTTPELRGGAGRGRLAASGNGSGR